MKKRRWDNKYKCGLVKGLVGIKLGSIRKDLAVKMGRVHDLVNHV